MARAIWSGAISFGLVNIPVKLFSAVSRKTVRFHQLDSETGSRIQQKRVHPKTGEEVPYEKLVKGYELSPDRYVVIQPEELEAIEPKKTRTIEISDFVEMEQIDPIYYDHPYYLMPGTGAEKPYALLLQALNDSERVAIARVVIRSKENLVAIRPRDGVLTMETLLFGDEVVSPDSLGEGELEQAKTTKKEVDMAMQLIDSLSADFDPDKYRDEYRLAVLEMIERKAEGKEIAVQEEAEEPAEVPDLMAALEASIANAKRQGGAAKSDGGWPTKAKAKPKSKAKSAPKKAKSASSNGSKSRASKSKRSTAKK
jgi:DNA end-binding protein Ku